jgi:HSP20 family molecular chaperone IbpA
MTTVYEKDGSSSKLYRPIDLINDIFDAMPEIVNGTAMNRMFKDHAKEYEKDIYGTDDSYPCNVIKRVTTKDNMSSECWILQFALAGFKKEEIDINIKGDVLEISAKPSATTADESVKDTYMKRRIAMRALKSSFKLGAKIDKTGFSAKFENGLLEIFLPVQEEKVFKVALN